MSVFSAYADALRQRGAHAAQALLPGSVLAGGQMRNAYPKLAPPDDLLALWQSFDGVGPTTTLEYTWLDGAFYFFSESEAIEDYQNCAPIWRDDPEFELYWPVGFFPIALPGDGSRLLINCNLGSPSHGAAYELLHGIGVSKAAASITRYFETALAWLDAGALWVDEAGRVQRDFKRCSEIARSLNPGCDAWDDTLPPAYETKDWIR